MVSWEDFMKAVKLGLTTHLTISSSIGSHWGFYEVCYDHLVMQNLCPFEKSEGQLFFEAQYNQ
jgi:hypothetical protein